jgi:tRNA(Ile)-lysidine synthase
VTFTTETLLRRLAELTDVAGQPNRYVIAFSGGLDSTVLTHALASTRAVHQVPLLAVHVDHGLQKESPTWAAHCSAFAAQFGIDLITRRVLVDAGSGSGPEAAAREARYAALRSLLEPRDWLLSAHHEDDQAETVMLNLMRGSGPAGLAGINVIRKFAAGWLARPLLDIPRSAWRRAGPARQAAFGAARCWRASRRCCSPTWPKQTAGDSVSEAIDCRCRRSGVSRQRDNETYCGM